MKYRITSTIADTVVNRSKINDIKELAYSALYHLMANKPEPSIGWIHFKKIVNWDGVKHTVLRHNGQSITLEKIP